VVGQTADGHPIRIAIGRFGPYVQFGAKKYASLKADDDPYTITLERAQQLIREKLETEANRIIRDFPEAGIQVLNGRYGPYVTDRKRNGKIPKDRDPKTLTLEECRTILESAPPRGARWGRKTTAAEAPPAAGAAPDQAKPATRVKAKTKARTAAPKTGGADGGPGTGGASVAPKPRVSARTPSKPAARKKAARKRKARPAALKKRAGAGDE